MCMKGNNMAFAKVKGGWRNSQYLLLIVKGCSQQTDLHEYPQMSGRQGKEGLKKS